MVCHLPANHHAVSRLYFAHDKDAVQASYALHGTQFGKHKALVRTHVARIYLHDKVVIARGIVAFAYLVHLLYGLHKLQTVLSTVLLQSYVAQHNEPNAHLLGIQNGCVALYIALALEPLLPLKGGRSG